VCFHKHVEQIARNGDFYPNVTTLRSGLCYRKSVCLSSVCNVRAPYSAVETFGTISSPLCTLAILWPTCKIDIWPPPRRPSQWFAEIPKCTQFLGVRPGAV